MDKGKFVADLLPGSSFSHSIFIVVSPEVKTGKTGNPYAMFTIEDNTGSASAKIWNITPEQERVLMSNTFFIMNGDVDTGTFAGQVKINSFKPVDESQVRMDDFLAPLPKDHKFHYERFIELIKSVKNPHLKNLLRKIFSEPKTLHQFKNAVAAKTMHHSHRGGLLEHSAEVAALCSKMCEVLPGLNRDLTVTCALVHDIGKLEEMEHGIHHGDYTADGNLLGHIVLGTQLVVAAMGDDFPPKLRLSVMHLILSHHKTFDFGSPKEPMIAEAQVLAACDELSARVFQHRLAPMSARTGANAVKTSNGWAFIEPLDELDTIESKFYPKSEDPLTEFVIGTALLPVIGTEETREVVLPTAGADMIVRVAGSELASEGYLVGDLVLASTHGKPGDGDYAVVSLPGRPHAVRQVKIDSAGGISILGFTALNEPQIGSDSWTIKGLVTGLIREI